MNGGVQTNLPKTAPHKDRHFDWFFIYFGYSKSKSIAYGFIKFNNGDQL